MIETEKTLLKKNEKKLKIWYLTNDPCVGLITTLYALILLVQFKGLGIKQGGTTKLLIGCSQSGHVCGISKQNRFFVGWQCLKKVIGSVVISSSQAMYFFYYFFFILIQCSLNYTDNFDHFFTLKFIFPLKLIDFRQDYTRLHGMSFTTVYQTD